MASEEKTKFTVKKPDKSFIKVEHTLCNERYAFNLAPELQFVGYDKKTRTTGYAQPHKTFKEYVSLHLKSCKNAIFELYFEVSPTGRQHYHGYITILDKPGFYTRDIHILNTIGSYLGKRITDPEIWHEYCTKQQSVWGTKYNIININEDIL
jgi:hypothetical protein